MKTILITGGAGFIGSHTCISLIKAGYKIVVADSFINSCEKSLYRVCEICNFSLNEISNIIKIFKVDIRDKDGLKNVFELSESVGFKIYGVIHFAGLKSVENSLEEPLKYWEVNVIGTINLISVMKKYKCHNIVFSSSATVYGSKHKNLIKEDDDLKPINPYGNSKLVVERFLNDLSLYEKNKWRIVILRYFNPIGAHPSGLIGEDPNGPVTNIFPTLNNLAIKKKGKLKIFGNNWPTKDGTSIRDYIHVMDIADGHKLALDYLFENNSEILYLNLGTGKGTSVLELLDCYEKINDVKIPYCFSKKRPGDVPILIADNSKAKKVLGWEPLRTIDDICKDGLKWQENNPNGYL